MKTFALILLLLAVKALGQLEINLVNSKNDHLMICYESGEPKEHLYTIYMKEDEDRCFCHKGFLVEPQPSLSSTTSPLPSTTTKSPGGTYTSSSLATPPPQASQPPGETPSEPDVPQPPGETPSEPDVPQPSGETPSEPDVPQPPGETPSEPDDSQHPGETPPKPGDSQHPGETPPKPGDSQHPGETPPKPGDSQHPGETPPKPGDSQPPGETPPKPDVTPTQYPSPLAPTFTPSTPPSPSTQTSPSTSTGSPLPLFSSTTSSPSTTIFDTSSGSPSSTSTTSEPPVTTSSPATDFSTTTSWSTTPYTSTVPPPSEDCHRIRKEVCVFGDPHFRTLDGAKFNYQGTCPLILSQPCTTLPGWDHFVVKMKSKQLNNFSSRIESAQIEIFETSFYFTQDELFVNGTQEAFPYEYDSQAHHPITVEKMPDSSVLLSAFKNIKVKFDGYALCLSFPDCPHIWGHSQLCGLLGNHDGFCLNDLKLSDGTMYSGNNPSCTYGDGVADFVESWITPEYHEFDATESGCFPNLSPFSSSFQHKKVLFD